MAKSIIVSFLKLIVRRMVRFAIKHGPIFLRKAAVRLPFSRFHRILTVFFSGEEKIRWRGVSVKINPGEILGYYPYFFGAYSNNEIQKLAELCEKAHIFADVGANIGMVSLSVARACPLLKVFAFEPDRDIARKFHDNLSLNQDLFPNVRLIEKAVADVEGDVFFQPSTDLENPATGKLTDVETPYTVSSVRLDTFFKGIGKYPDVVKIDVEGEELRVLCGMRNLFNKGYPKAILVETHPYCHDDFLAFNAKVKRTLEEAHFSLFQLADKVWKRVGPAENQPVRLHILAIRKKVVRNG